MLKKIYFCFIFLIGAKAFSFPEMIRHHYINCSACHVSTSGGGLLNAYGRTISYDVLSSWGTEKEARAFYAIDPEKTSEWLNLGGDVRGVQVHQDNALATTGRFIWMEANVQAALTHKGFTAYVSAGKIKQANQSFDPAIAKYYAAYQISDELSVRGGLYIPVYGLNIPQHNYLVRQSLQLGPGSERHAADIQWNGETWNFVAGASRSLADSAVADEEQAVNLQVQRSFNDKYKFGVNFWSGEAVNYKKTAVGAQAVLGWSENLYTLVEADNMVLTDLNTDIDSKYFLQLLKVGYELYKGFHLQAVQEFGTTTTSDTKSLGAGFIWYPRPHFEVETLASKKLITTTSDSNEDYAYLLLHFYF